MCMILKKKRKYIASRDITVYVVRLKNFLNITSPFHKGTTWEIGKINRITKDNQISHKNIRLVIDRGFFHSFKRKADAISYWGYELKNLTEYKLFKAIIPKGTEYYNGRMVCEKCQNRASVALKLVEEVKC